MIKKTAIKIIIKSFTRLKNSCYNINFYLVQKRKDYTQLKAKWDKGKDNRWQARCNFYYKCLDVFCNCIFILGFFLLPPFLCELLIYLLNYFCSIETIEVIWNSIELWNFDEKLYSKDLSKQAEYLLPDKKEEVALPTPEPAIYEDKEQSVRIKDANDQMIEGIGRLIIVCCVLTLLHILVQPHIWPF